MKKILLLTLAAMSLMAQAQQVAVVEKTRLLEGVAGAAYRPVLSPDGSRLLFASGDAAALRCYDFADNVVTTISDEACAGTDAFWGGDGKVYYVTQQRDGHNLVYRTGHAYDPATATSAVVLGPQHGAVRPMPATRGGALRSQARNYGSADLGTAVTTEGSEVVVSVNGRERRFSPVAPSAGYLWASLSPDRRRVAFFAAGHGIIVTDLDGNILARPGNYEMPCWYDNDYLVAQNATDDGHQFTSSQIVLLRADGSGMTPLTPPTSMAMQPTAAAGKIVYTTVDGLLWQMKINVQPK